MKRFSSFVDLLSTQNPSAFAFEYLDNEELKKITFKELVNKISTFELPKENVIGLFLDNNIDSLVAFFAMTGRKQIIILDPNDKDELLIKKIKRTHINRLMGECEIKDELNEYLEKENLINDRNILFFTSGTTSESKAVVLTEKSLCSATYNGGSLLPLTEKDKLLSVLPYSHVFGMVCSLLWPLSFGATICLGNGIRKIFTDFALYQPTATSLVPEMAKFLVFNKLFNKELKLILIGAGSCDDMTINAIKALGIRLSYGYGLTETSSGIALSLEDNPRAMSICPDYQVRIAEDGEIIVKSDYTLMQGYFEDKESTDKVLKGNELYTGDLGKIENGYLFITGRKKEIFVFSDGSKLFIPEYEAELAKRLGPDSDFTVLQNIKGQIILYIHKPKDIEKVVDEFNSTQSRSHKIERIIYSDSKLPRTNTGKIQKYLLKIGD